MVYLIHLVVLNFLLVLLRRKVNIFLCFIKEFLSLLLIIYNILRVTLNVLLVLLNLQC